MIYLSEDANELNVPQKDRKFHKEKGIFHKKRGRKVHKALHKREINKIIYSQIKNITIMKKLVFAAIAALVMVSVSNVFASNKMASVSCAAPVDTVAPADTTATPAENEVTPAENAAQDSTAATPAESTDSAATAE